MGCRQAKHTKTLAVNGKFDTLDPPAPPPPDSRLPLTARQIFKLKKNWKGIHRNMVATGTEMFVRLFRNNAELKSLFKDFKDVKSDDELRENEVLEAHGTLVMGILDEAISNIDNVDHVIEVCQRAGQTHSRFTGFTSDLFWNMEQPFLEAIRIILGDRYSDQMDVIYQLSIKFILNNLQKGFQAAS